MIYRLELSIKCISVSSILKDTLEFKFLLCPVVFKHAGTFLIDSKYIIKHF